MDQGDDGRPLRSEAGIGNSRSGRGWRKPGPSTRIERGAMQLLEIFFRNPPTEGPSPRVPPRHARRSRRLLRRRRATRSPRAAGRPLVVGAAPGRRGVVANCSYEARRFGVRSAMPISEAVRRLPADTVYLRLDMSRYADVSRQIMRVVLGTLAPVVEPFAIDETYLNVFGLERMVGPPEVVARRTKVAIREAVGLTAWVASVRTSDRRARLGCPQAGWNLGGASRGSPCRPGSDAARCSARTHRHTITYVPVSTQTGDIVMPMQAPRSVPGDSHRSCGERRGIISVAASKPPNFA